MAASNDFKQQLKSGKILAALRTALSEAIELEITTWVSSAEESNPAEQPSAGSRLQTRINIVDGDISNEIGDQFLSNGPYHELQQFHFQQVKAGQEIIQNNLQSLQKLFGMLMRTQSPNLDVEDVSSLSPPPLPPAEQGEEAGEREIEINNEDLDSLDIISESLAEVNPTIEGVPFLDVVPPVVVTPESSAEVQTEDSVPVSTPSEVSSVVPGTSIPNGDSLEQTVDQIFDDSTMTTPTVGETSDWEDDEDGEDLKVEQPKPKPPTPAQLGWGLDWGTEEEWEELDLGEDRETFIGLPVTGGDTGWDDDEDWGDDEEEEPNSAEVAPPDQEVSNAIAALFGETPSAKAQPSPPRPDNISSPVNLEEALFTGDTPLDTAEDTPLDTADQDPSSPPPSQP